MADRLQKPVKILSALLLLVIILLALAKDWQTFVTYAPVVGLAALAFNLLSLAVGYWVPRLLRLPKAQAVAIGMEIGIHNGTLAIALALFTTSVVLAIAAISNDNLQDLKTGYLVGATPWRQQVALIVGCLVGALVIPPVLELLFNAYGFTGALPRAGMDPNAALAAPQATLMTAIASGIFHNALNWNMILIGVALGIALILVDLLLRRTGKACLPVLAVGLGIYLPPTIGMTLVVGALISWLLENALKKRAAAAGVDEETYAEEPKRRGVLLASGLIVGESLMGILLAGVIGATGEDAPLALAGAGFAGIAQWLGLVVFVAICVLFYRRVLAR